MENNQHIKELYRKFLDNSISDAEYEELLQYFGSEVSREGLLELILQALENNDEEKIIHIHRQRIDRTIRHVKERLSYTIDGTEPEKSSLFRRLSPYIAAAALLVIGIFSYHYFTQPTEPQIQLVADGTEDINPGTNRATLMLANGTIYELSEGQDGITTDENGIRYADGQNIIEEVSPSIISLAIPRGGQYKVTLPDGTNVFVNSGSLLKYPTQFSGRYREVELSGEAYFQVAHNPDMPFVVKGSRQEIHVLGTKFNISDYQEEAPTTTLVEGSVQVDFGSDTKVTLMPGQQSVLDNEKVVVNNVNVADYIAWTEDLFVFNDMSLTTIMKQLERWYDIEVTYPLAFKDERFFAEIRRNMKLSEVLSALEESGNFRFEQQGRRVIVRQ